MPKLANCSTSVAQTLPTTDAEIRDPSDFQSVSSFYCLLVVADGTNLRKNCGLCLQRLPQF